MHFTVRNFSFSPTFPYYDTDLAPFYSRFTAVPAHFDGIHYLRLAGKGYDDDGSQAFFPLYPFLISTLSTLGVDPIFGALLINLLSLAGFATLMPWRVLILLLTFPASFFLLTVYTESLFLFLLSLSLFLLSKKKYFLATLAIALLTATRLVGLAMLVPLAFALYPRIKSMLLYLPLAASGFLSYVFYLWVYFDDALKFIHVQPLFGGGRTGEGIVLLPQVLYRYFSMFITVDPGSLLFWRSVFEFSVFALAAFTLVYFRKQLSPGLWWYSLLVLIIPTLSGSLSSFPRYSLAALPLFMVAALSLSPKKLLAVAVLQSLLLILALSLFTRGLFVA